MGFAWAFAFNKTGSMALPIGLHLGWNFVFNAIFTKAFVSTPVINPDRSNHVPLEGFLSVVNFLVQNILPSILTLIFLKLYSKKTAIQNSVHPS